MQNKKTALYLLITYIVMQTWGVFFLQPLYRFYKGQHPTWTHEKLEMYTQTWFMFFSMLAALIISLILITRDKQFFDNYPTKASIPKTILWGLIGFAMIYVGQTIASKINSLFGISVSSENTASLLDGANIVPIAALATVVFAPILEELVFRRVIFGSIYQTRGFWPAAIISTVFFALIHFDFAHISLYAITGLILAFLYHKTGRIITPMIAHILLNGFVSFIQ